MADSAAQFSFVSSTTSTSSTSVSSLYSARSQPGGCTGGGSVSCADPPNSSSSSSSSSSQPVSLFAASPAAPGGRDRAVSPGGATQSPPESPESPFEVVPDRAAFDREFGPALGQIPEGRVCHFPPKPRGVPGAVPGVPGVPGVPPGRGLARPPPGSAAALEEVSRCVREMHNFTSELLSWDLVERNGGSGDIDGGNGDINSGNGDVGGGNGDVDGGNDSLGISNGISGVGNGGTGIGNGSAGMKNGVAGVTSVTGLGNGVTGIGNGSAGVGNGVTGVTGMGNGVTDVTATGNGVTGIGIGVTGIGNGVSAVPGVGSGISAVPGIGIGVTGGGIGVTAVPTDADSSGDSDDTVIEEALGEVPPASPKDVPKAVSTVPKDVPTGPKDVPAGPRDVPKDVLKDVPAIPKDVPKDVPAGPKDVPKEVPRDVPAVPKDVPRDVPAGPKDVPKEVPRDVPAVPRDVPAVPKDVPKDVPRDVPAGPKDVPRDVPSPPVSPPAASRDWEQEHQTLRALRELGEPPQAPPAGPLPRLAVRELLFWRDVKKSAVAFGASLVLLLSLATLSAVTVVAHVALALLSVTISLRVYKAVVQALQKSEEGHPFRAYLDLDVTLSPETFQAHAAVVAQRLNQGLQLLIRLFLVEDLVDSLELAMTMWLMTYVGAIFNGITLLILADLLAFTFPPLYEKYKVQIDHYVGLVRRQTRDLMAKIQAKLPGLAKKKPE